MTEGTLIAAGALAKVAADLNIVGSLTLDVFRYKSFSGQFKLQVRVNLSGQEAVDYAIRTNRTPEAWYGDSQLQRNYNFTENDVMYQIVEVAPHGSTLNDQGELVLAVAPS